MSTRNLPTSANFGITGLVGTVGYTVIDTAGGTLVARTTAGITEAPAGSGKYLAVATLDSAWNGYIDWDDGSGNYASQPFEAITGGTGVASLPATRKLPFTYETGNPPALTDVTSAVLSDQAGTYGARRADTLATLVAANVALTHDGTGSYSYTITENGYPIEYWVKYVVGAETRYDRFLSNPPQIHYATRADIEAEIGVDDALVYADLNNNRDAAEIAARFEAVLTFADQIVNSELGMNSITLVDGLPTWVDESLRTIAAKIASWQLGQGRDHTQVNPDAARKDLQNRYDWAMDRLAKLIGSGALTITTTDDTYVVAAPVAAGATVNANGCALPTTVCWPPYGHYARACN